VSDESAKQRAKHSSQSFSAEAAIEIDESDSQDENAPASMHESFEPGSNVTVTSGLYPQKHFLHSVSIEDGMQIEESAHPANTEAAIDKRCEPGSKVTVDRDWQSAKHFSEKLATDAGMQREESDEQFRKT
jgi:hypothetical protein